MQKTAYEIGVRLVGSEMCIRDSPDPAAPAHRDDRHRRPHHHRQASAQPERRADPRQAAARHVVTNLARVRPNPSRAYALVSTSHSSTADVPTTRPPAATDGGRVV